MQLLENGHIERLEVNLEADNLFQILDPEFQPMRYIQLRCGPPQSIMLSKNQIKFRNFIQELP